MPTWPWRKPRPGVDNYGRSPLWYQAAEGDVAAIQKSLKAGMDATAADKDGFSALHVAAEYGHGTVIKTLIAAGADVNCIDRYGNGPLWVASRCANAPGYDLGIVTALIEAGADMNHRNHVGKTPPGWAMKENLRAIYRGAGYTGDFEL
ncbi:MAG: ankyrin repeat domain-containing protein [Sphingopyxis terrae]|nr:ankyrin repeat domain-containing protein [Sphingopyxis terrae]